MSSILVVSPEPVRARMAGMGIRALRIAETLLGAGHAVTLAAPASPGERAPAGSVGIAGLERDDPAARGFAGRASRFDVAIVSGHAGGAWLKRFDGAVVADLYDPFAIENLAYAGSLGPAVWERDRATLLALLSRADLVLAATEEQRLFYLGLLVALDRVDPEDAARDPEGLTWVALAPFGVDDTPPGPPAYPAPLTPGPHDVFFGGVYDWYDPALVLEAWPAVLSRVPAARLLFSTSPNPETTPQERLESVRKGAGGAGLLDVSVLFLPWVDVAARGGLYSGCRAAVLAHRPSLETELSFRTRVLDFLWAGLPIVSTRGGRASRLISESGSGLVVEATAGELAAALASVLLDDALRSRLAENARRAARSLGWAETLRPLLAFAASPARRRARRSRPSSAAFRLLERLAGRGAGHGHGGA